MRVCIDDRQNKVKLDENLYKILEQVVKECLVLEGKSLSYEISISFVDNEEIRLLNKKYRNIDSTTDVLSFPLDGEMLVPIPLLGDIVISAEKALEQAKDYGHSFVREVAYLTAHSMLHLFGYDHIDKEERTIMRNKEKEIMKRLKIFKDEK
ncbi:putative rRNA maturation factor [Keratinibaculum paraultunense]|uniref:Endoribonuclease YbeY n=1 Tax=Keratinibaculum paraultunense TaxID=1278232 RepID=A0A4V2UUK4_9FIRM|nr:rRNA maturation RNase YbeY [Keratinibaculum paraultunense]QQY80476.1 rRNA maturation RNase YbeY [Keratinibaculum paraultunense]TCS91194.1 putative rRNA maturation factor [Keratinibaculum paraultunense]